MTRSLLTLLLLLSLAAPARAVPTDLDYAPPAPPAPPDPGGLVLRLIGMTLVLFVVCGGVLWFARRAALPRGLKGDGGGRLRHEGSLVLDRHCVVHLIRADGQTIAVTTDSTGIRSIVVLSEPFEAALASAGVDPPAPAGA
jgi:hypothetical protein